MQTTFLSTEKVLKITMSCFFFFFFTLHPKIPLAFAFPGTETVSQPKYENTHQLRSTVTATSCRPPPISPTWEKKKGEKKQPFASEGSKRVIVTPVSGGKVLSERLAGPSGIPSAEENWKNTDSFFDFLKLGSKKRKFRNGKHPSVLIY